MTKLKSHKNICQKQKLVNVFKKTVLEKVFCLTKYFIGNKKQRLSLVNKKDFGKKYSQIILSKMVSNLVKI